MFGAHARSGNNQAVGTFVYYDIQNSSDVAYIPPDPLARSGDVAVIFCGRLTGTVSPSISIAPSGWSEPDYNGKVYFAGGSSSTPEARVFYKILTADDLDSSLTAISSIDGSPNHAHVLAIWRGNDSPSVSEDTAAALAQSLTFSTDATISYTVSASAAGQVSFLFIYGRNFSDFNGPSIGCTVQAELIADWIRFSVRATTPDIGQQVTYNYNPDLTPAGAAVALASELNIS